MANLLVIRPNPARMGAESRKEERRPNADLTNFTSWYRYLSQERQGQVMELNNTLREIITSFDYLRLQEAGEGKLLMARFKGGVEYKLDELSDGQRMLIALYTLLHCLPEEGATICIDEPENFLAISEIQPWLDELDESCTEGPHQAILISHHPRPINLLAKDAGIWIDRAGIDQPSRVHAITDDGQGVSIAQLVERGWIYDA
jgi:predicted ATPase